MKKIIILIILMSCFMLSGCGFTRYNNYDDANKYQIGNFSYNRDSINRIVINWVAGDITIIETDDNELNVTENATTLKDDARIHYYLDGNTLRIEYAKSKYRGNIDALQKKLEIEIPKNISLEMDVVSANINLENGNMTSLSIESVSGDVKISELNVQKAEIESVSGNININKLSTDKLEANTTSGNISIGLNAINNLEMESVSGNIKLTLLKEIGFILDFETVSGDFETALSCTIKNGEYQYLEGNCQMDVETVSGDLDINIGV